jgi:hypothetical protein
MPFVRHRGQRIHYTVDGEGPAIVTQPVGRVSEA